MDSFSLHHAEYYVSDGEKLSRDLTNKYKFALIAKRSIKSHNQWVLCSGNAKFLITQPKTFDVSDAITFTEDHLVDPYISNQYLSLGINSAVNIANASKTFVNTVCNIALKVKDVKHCVQRVCQAGGEVLKPPNVISDINGSVETAIIKSCIGNVIHTIVDDSKYKGSFLPGFEDVDNPCSGCENPLVTHIDHVTFACALGASGKILKWYENNLGMNRFYINSDEDTDDGFVIDTEDIGIRLKAFEYWKCAETGLYSQGPDNSLKFVIAEALEGQGPNQIDTFLEEHRGDGIQHIGLHTESIVNAVSTLQEQGVNFVEPPYTYYTEVGKLKEMEEINEDVEVLKKYGILVDNEADPDTDSSEQRYLMQKFTQPLFDEKTFFLEIIQRFGARGFGSGNITALWRSMQAYLSEEKS
ncbi:unnamed protein product [Mytilus coruscus]|uniref:4-hydroxyphenylpyruvate dioxygenase n=1 Tax=Mytilus coruscus TaxID=42192 RepID=A0A6J8DW90_MYTCO|nr:unnamed protein product [Mytilus coruscus]